MDALFTVFDGLGCNWTICPRWGYNEPCRGETVVCDQNNNLVSLDIHVPLTGTISWAIGLLSSLTLLRLVQSGGLQGTIPTEIGSLSRLTRLCVSFVSRLALTIFPP